MSRLRLLSIGAALGAALLGYGLVHLALGSANAPSAQTTAPGTVTVPTPALSTLVIRAAKPDPATGSRQAAVLAAVSYLRALEPASATPARRSRVRALTVGPLTELALRAQAAGAAVWRKLSAHGPAVARGWALGYRVGAYDVARARVTIWTVGLVASAIETVAPTWSETTCSLVRRDGAWRVAAARTTPGPTPPIATTSPRAVAGFARAAQTLQALGDAP